jgi:hypothetical protein
LRPASEKRQGTKSREVGHRRCRGRYGDLAAGSGLRRLDRNGRGDRLPARCGSPSAGRPPTYYTHGAITPTGASRGSGSSSYGPHTKADRASFVDDPHAAYEGSSAVTPRSRMRHKPTKSFAALGLLKEIAGLRGEQFYTARVAPYGTVQTGLGTVGYKQGWGPLVRSSPWSRSAK